MSLDVGQMRALHAQHSKMDLGTDFDVLAGMHSARTQLDIIPLRDREYSHFWLIDRGLPSQLPPMLLPKADRFMPRIVEGVGIMVDASTPDLAPAARMVQRRMEDVVLDAYADSNSPDPKALQARMMEARKKELRSLILPDRAER